jgi:hypothetical protein
MFREVNACIYANKQPDWRGDTRLSEAAIDDIRWISHCFGAWNARGAPIWVQSTVVPVQFSLVGDAGPRAVGFQVRQHGAAQVLDAISSLPATLAARWSDHVTSLPVPGSECSPQVARQNFCVTDESIHSVTTTEGTIELTDAETEMEHVHKELLMVWLVLKSQCLALANRRLCIFVDATTTVAYLNNWGGPSIWCCRVVKHIWALCAEYGIRIVQVSHIKGTTMITSGVDALSRPPKFSRGKEADRDDWRLLQHRFDWLQVQLQVKFTIDRMATRANRRCEAFCSISEIDPDSEGPSAFATDWAKQKKWRSPMNYVFPPFALIPRVLQHIRECKVWAVVVVPNWPSQCWWPDMMDIAIQVTPFPNDGPVFERVKDKVWQPVTTTSFLPLAVTVHPGRCRQY